MQPIAPPDPVEIYIKVIKSWEPNAGSFRDWITIIASVTTFTNASDNEAAANINATASGSYGSANASENKAINCSDPIIINQLFLFDPNIGTLSDINPYRIFKLHGI